MGSSRRQPPCKPGIVIGTTLTGSSNRGIPGLRSSLGGCGTISGGEEHAEGPVIAVEADARRTFSSRARQRKKTGLLLSLARAHESNITLKNPLGFWRYGG